MSLKTVTISTENLILKKNLEGYITNDTITITKENIGIISNLLAEYVINYIDDKVITKIIKSKTDIDEISDFKKYFNIKIKEYMNRKLRLYDMILEGIKSSNKLNFDGFVKFRLREYYNLIESVLPQITKDYETEREYQGFIYLIRELLNSQVSIIYNLHVCVSDDEKYYIYDDYYNDITEICINEFLGEFEFKYVNNDDFLFSTILSMAPKKITIHHYKRMKNKELIDTIKNIYFDNLIFCDGCEFCLST